MVANKTHPTVDDGVAIRLSEVARRIDCSTTFLEKQIALGRLRCIRLSPRCVRIRTEDLAITSTGTDLSEGTDAMPRKLSAEMLTDAQLEELAPIGLSDSEITTFWNLRKPL